MKKIFFFKLNDSKKVFFPPNFLPKARSNQNKIFLKFKNKSFKIDIWSIYVLSTISLKAKIKLIFLMV